MASRLVSRDFRRSRSSEHVGKFDGFIHARKKYLIDIRNNSIFMASDEFSLFVVLFLAQVVKIKVFQFFAFNFLNFNFNSN